MTIELLEALYVAVVRFEISRRPLTRWQRAYIERVLRTLNGE